MSQNDHTGLEGYTNDELVSQAYHEFDDLIHPPIMMELAKRLEIEGDAAKQLAEIDNHLSGDMTVADLLKLSDAVIDHSDTTVALLDVLNDHGIESATALRTILDAVSKIQNAA